MGHFFSLACHTSKVLLSAKLHVSQSRSMRQRSLIEILRSNGTNSNLDFLRYFYLSQCLPFDDFILSKGF